MSKSFVSCATTIAALLVASVGMPLGAVLLLATASLLLWLAWPGSAHAYVGPGAGMTLIGSFLGLLAAVGLALWALLLWPIRRLLKRRRQARQDGSAGAETDEAG